MAKKNIKKLVEIAERHLKSDLISCLNNLGRAYERMNSIPESIANEHTFKMLCEIYNSKMDEINELKVDVKDILMQYESIIKEYGLNKK